MTDEQREVLDRLADFTEDTFLQPQYADWLLRDLRQLRDAGQSIGVDAAAQWAREREWPEIRTGMLAGVVWTVRYELTKSSGG